VVDNFLYKMENKEIWSFTWWIDKNWYIDFVEVWSIYKLYRESMKLVFADNINYIYWDEHETRIHKDSIKDFGYNLYLWNMFIIDNIDEKYLT